MAFENSYLGWFSFRENPVATFASQPDECMQAVLLAVGAFWPSTLVTEEALAAAKSVGLRVAERAEPTLQTLVDEWKLDDRTRALAHQVERAPMTSKFLGLPAA